LHVQRNAEGVDMRMRLLLAFRACDLTKTGVLGFQHQKL